VTDADSTTPVYGLIENETLWHWLPVHEAVISGLANVAVTEIDSSRDVERTGVASFGLGRVVPYREGCSALLVSGRELLELSERGAFTGFDEICIYDEAKPDDVLPAAAFDVVSRPRWPDTAADAAELASAMAASGLTATLGDGLGLRYLAVSEIDARALGLPVG
jgi:hypothetical protein